jgi:predicted ABC-type sugar transport system permease subunit
MTKELELPSLNRLSIFNRISSSTYLTSIGLIGVILLMILIFSFLNPNFYSGTNLRNVTRQTSILDRKSVV